jgi:hypothetical protein
MLELRAQLMEQCDHYSLMSISRANRDARSTVQFEIRCRIRTVLQPFIPFPLFESFMDMLHRMESVVYGSVVRRLLMINSCFEQDLDEPCHLRYNTSGNLNIATPPHTQEQCQAWFTLNGYGQWTKPKDQQPARGFRSVMTKFVQGRKPVPGSENVRELFFAFPTFVRYLPLVHTPVSPGSVRGNRSKPNFCPPRCSRIWFLRSVQYHFTHSHLLHLPQPHWETVLFADRHTSQSRSPKHQCLL